MIAPPLALLGIPSLFRRMMFKCSITILVYHDPAAESFERHVKWLIEHYSVVSIDLMYEALKKDDISSLGKFPLLITVDDGRKGNYQLLPVIKKYSIRPCFYLCSSVVGTRRRLWDDCIVGNAPHELKKMKAMSEFERREYLSTHFGMAYEDEGKVRSMLSADEIHDMLPYVDFASHGCFHLPFSSLTDEELHQEVVNSKLEIDAITGMPCKHFSYPTGMYDSRCESALKGAGYVSVRTTDYGRNISASDIYYLHAVGVSDDASLDKLEVQSSGLYSFLRERVLAW